MMLIRRIACPSCNVKLRVAESLPAGKEITCPKCSHDFPVPEEEGEAEPEEVVVVRRRKPAPPPEDDEEEDDEVRVKRSPKRRKKVKKSKGNPMLVWGLVIGAAVLVIGGGVAFAVVRTLGKKEVTVAENNTSPPASTPGPEAGAPEAKMMPGMGPGMRPGMGPGGMRPGMGPGGMGPGGNGPGAETPPPSTGGGDSDRFASARALFQRNCSRCHSLGGGRSRGPDLSRIGSNPEHNADWIAQYIRNPTSKNPNSRMPPFEDKLKDEDVRALAEYLASLK
jgi:mono/diheme cytochrome c family protein